MTHTPGTDLGALLVAAAELPEQRRRTIEPLLTARLRAAATITEAGKELLAAWRELHETSRALDKIFEDEGWSRPCLTEPTWRKAVEAELWKLSGGYDPSKLGQDGHQFPCVCGGATERPEMLVPLIDQVRDANNRIRARLT